MTWFMSGGIPMIFVLVFGLMAVAGGFQFARAPGRGDVRPHAALAFAVLCASVCGVLTDLTTVATQVPANPEWAESPDLHLILLIGLGESLAPGVLGFALVAVQALLVSFGLRRAA
jgi:hypothetical protein